MVMMWLLSYWLWPRRVVVVSCFRLPYCCCAQHSAAPPPPPPLGTCALRYLTVTTISSSTLPYDVAMMFGSQHKEKKNNWRGVNKMTSTIRTKIIMLLCACSAHKFLQLPPTSNHQSCAYRRISRIKGTTPSCSSSLPMPRKSQKPPLTIERRYASTKPSTADAFASTRAHRRRISGFPSMRRIERSKRFKIPSSWWTKESGWTSQSLRAEVSKESSVPNNDWSIDAESLLQSLKSSTANGRKMGCSKMIRYLLYIGNRLRPLRSRRKPWLPGIITRSGQWFSRIWKSISRKSSIKGRISASGRNQQLNPHCHHEPNHWTLGHLQHDDPVVRFMLKLLKSRGEFWHIMYIPYILST